MSITTPVQLLQRSGMDMPKTNNLRSVPINIHSGKIIVHRQPTPKRRKFSQEETDAIKAYFARHLEDHEIPTTTIAECREFLEVQNMAHRTQKNIQDKFRTIIRST